MSNHDIQYAEYLIILHVSSYHYVPFDHLICLMTNWGKKIYKLCHAAKSSSNIFLESSNNLKEIYYNTFEVKNDSPEGRQEVEGRGAIVAGCCANQE